MHLTASERIILHIAEHWRSQNPLPELTQKGIASASGVLRSHVPRNLKKLMADGDVEEAEGRISGRGRKVKFYRITEAGLRRAREIEEGLADESLMHQGKEATVAEISKLYNMTPLHVALRTDSSGMFTPPSMDLVEVKGLIEREDDLSYLHKWLREGGPVAVVYGSTGMGKTSLGKELISKVKRRVVWVNLSEKEKLANLLNDLADALGLSDVKKDKQNNVLDRMNSDKVLVVIDGYHDVEEEIVDFFSMVLARLKEGHGKLLILAQETTPSYCRFYTRSSINEGDVWERHLKGLSLQGCKKLLGTERIDDEALKCIFLLTKGTPLYIELIRHGNAEELQRKSRFTNAEIRLLLFSRDVVKQT